MRYDESRINRLKRPFIRILSESLILNKYCKEMWIFGSSVDNCSAKTHTPSSDVDIAILSCDNNLDSEINKQIHKCICNILYKNKINFDIIWKNVTDVNSPILKEIEKGVRII